MTKEPQPTLHDTIVAFLREHPEGVPAGELGERFLKLRSSSATGVAAAIRAMLLPDRRCFLDEHGLWHARTGKPSGGPVLRGLPFSAVYGLIHPESRRVWHLSLWEIAPAASCSASGWLIDPAKLLFDDRDRLINRQDPPYSPDAASELLKALSAAEDNRIRVFLCSADRDRIAAACSAIGESLADDSMVVSELLRAADLPVPRPLTLAALEQSVPGAPEIKANSARNYGEQFAYVVAELLGILGRKGIETRDDLDALLRRENAPLFAGKEFSYDDLLALPATPAVYAFKNAADEYLYIGKARNLKRRLLGYFCETDESPAKLDRLRTESRRLITHPCGSELECLIHEFRLIRKYSPPLNRQVEIAESRGPFRPIDDCIVLLQHALPGKVMSVWVRKEQKILLKALDPLPDTSLPIIAELNAFFFGGKLTPESTDFPEHQIATRWIRRHADELEIVPVHRMADAEEVYEAIRASVQEAFLS
jgi:hypothetical protein